MVRRALWAVWVVLLSLATAMAGCSEPRTADSREWDPEVQAPGAPPAKAKTSRGFFHKLSSDTAVVYLLGSVHIGKAELFPMEQPIENAFAEADTLVLELDFSDQSQSTAQREVLATATYPQGQSLETELDAQTLTLLKNRLKERQLPFEQIAQLRPWLVALTLTVLELKRAGYEEGQGVDLHFAKRAQGKRIVALETAEQQLSLFADMADREQLLMLRQTLEDLDETPAMLEQALVAWKSSDEKSLVSALLAPMQEAEYRAVYEVVFVDRNDKMTRAIEGFLEQRGTFFVVVGAGHVVGNDGIVARLRKRGHEVEQL